MFKSFTCAIFILIIVESIAKEPEENEILQSFKGFKTWPSYEKGGALLTSSYFKDLNEKIESTTSKEKDSDLHFTVNNLKSILKTTPQAVKPENGRISLLDLDSNSGKYRSSNSNKETLARVNLPYFSTDDRLLRFRRNIFSAPFEGSNFESTDTPGSSFFASLKEKIKNMVDKLKGYINKFLSKIKISVSTADIASDNSTTQLEENLKDLLSA